jgi:hypothetical protein
MNFSCCITKPLHNPVNQHYVHPDFIETSAATFLGGSLCLIVGARAVWINKVACRRSTRHAIQARVDALKAEYDDQVTQQIESRRVRAQSVAYGHPDVAEDPFRSPQESAVRLLADFHDIEMNVHASERRLEEMQQRLALVKAAQNPDVQRINQLMMMCICLRILCSTNELVFAIFTFAGEVFKCCTADSPEAAFACIQEEASPDAGRSTGVQIYALTRDECNTSAMLDQYFWSASSVCNTLFLAAIVWPVITRKWWTPLLLCHVVAAGTTLAMWFVLAPHTHYNTPFQRALTWCWIPDIHSAGHFGIDPYTLLALQIACCYIWAPISLIAGLRAMCALKCRLHEKFVVERVAVNRRLIPQIAFYVAIIAFDVFGRVVSTSAQSIQNTVILTTLAFLVPVSGAVIAIIWAYGEGLVPLLLRPFKYNFTNFPVTTKAFSVVAAWNGSIAAPSQGRTADDLTDSDTGDAEYENHDEPSINSQSTQPPAGEKPPCDAAKGAKEEREE